MENTWLYFFSTIAQCIAGLIAVFAALSFYRLQTFENKTNEQVNSLENLRYLQSPGSNHEIKQVLIHDIKLAIDSNNLNSFFDIIFNLNKGDYHYFVSNPIVYKLLSKVFLGYESCLIQQNQIKKNLKFIVGLSLLILAISVFLILFPITNNVCSTVFIIGIFSILLITYLILFYIYFFKIFNTKAENTIWDARFKQLNDDLKNRFLQNKSLI